VNGAEETDRGPAEMPSYAGPGRFSIRRIHLSEAIVGLGGIAMLAGLFMPWSDGTPAIEAISLLKLLVVLVGAASAVVPAIVAFSSKTDLPMAWETLLAVAVTLLTLVLLVRLLLPPDGSMDDGFFVVLGGTVLTVLAGWRSVAREY
jgi:hypothetical protein